LQRSSPTTRPRTAEGGRPFSASPSKLAGRGASPLMRSPSPAGMATSIKSDLAAWRAK
jgi:hypothetical protein